MHQIKQSEKKTKKQSNYFVCYVIPCGAADVLKYLTWLLFWLLGPYAADATINLCICVCLCVLWPLHNVSCQGCMRRRNAASCCSLLTKRFTWCSSCDVISCADFTSATVQERHKVTRVVVLGGGAGSRIIWLSRLLDEGLMGKPMAHPQNGNRPANGSPSGHWLTHKWWSQKYAYIYIYIRQYFGGSFKHDWFVIRLQMVKDGKGDNEAESKICEFKRKYESMLKWKGNLVHSVATWLQAR